VPLPSPDSLSLSEAAALVKERCDVSENEAKKALQRAGIDGRLEATGAIPLSAHRDPAVRARYPVRKHVNVPADAWNGEIDWIAGTVGRYFTVSVKRASIEVWLGVDRAQHSTSPLRPAPESEIKDEIRRQYDKADSAKQKPPNVKEIVAPVQTELRIKGLDASGRQIQKFAEAEEFKNRRGKPGATLKYTRPQDP
jgi:hypothetical protein